ncbi:MAG: B12-binding domain-containing radical SAM protein, partial [Prochlorococcaceae cyanobacterium]
VYPEFSKTFWSYETILELVNRKALPPPLGLITVAAILPQKWNFKPVDVNIRAVTEQEWMWADLAIMSGMIVQKDDIIRQINLPMFVAAWYGGDKGGRFSSEGVKPDVTSTPIPRHDLLEFKAYNSMSVPFSRSCRLQCEFCIFDVLHGRKPQAKAPE